MDENSAKAAEESSEEKIKELQRLLDEQKKISEDMFERIKYLQADFDNYRKNMEKEKSRIIELANENLIKELLPILDDFEAAIKTAESENDRKGIELLNQKLTFILEKYGLKSIETEGKMDPHKHEAVLREESDKEDGTIIEKLQKGYMLNSKVIRPARVKVAKNSGDDKNGKRKDNRN